MCELTHPGPPYPSVPGPFPLLHMLNRKLRRLLDRLLLVPALCLAIGPAQTAAAAIGGGDYFVSGSGDDVTGDGTEGNPWRTITHAVSEAGGGAELP